MKNKFSTKCMTLLLVLILMLAAFAGCTQKSEQPAKTTETSQQTNTGEDASEQPQDDKGFTIVMVAKLDGIAWFDDMRSGVEQFGADHDDVTAYQIAPEGGDSAKQIALVEDLIAQQVDAILVVPNDPVAMKPVLQKAREAGIIVISHEASNIPEVVDFDLEAFDNAWFGQQFGENLAQAMGGKGKYATMVGRLTMITHMQWCEAATAYIAEKYPDMELINEEPYEDENTDSVAYEVGMEVLTAHPDLAGFVSFALGGGVAQAIEEKGRTDIPLISLGSPSEVRSYIKDGTMRLAQAWRPFDAGYVCAEIAYKMLKGGTIDKSFSSTKPGYESITLDGNVIYGSAGLVFTKDNIDNYDY